MILGAILAGGAARRFGSDKAMARLQGRALIDHVRDALEPWVDRVAVCGRNDGSPLMLSDRPAPGLGPLGGLAAALHFADAQGFARVLTAPCDTPFIDRRVFETLVAADGPAFVESCPVIGLWPARLSHLLDDYLAGSEDRAMRAWARHIDADSLDLPVPINVNRPADLESLGA
ncbi:MAG: molybdenum cofactor guanylyltransferase [Sphingomonas sp.]|uniref:molybdenum cofactor guanylyltransferase n=1 Tax=Sphingomonas sp. TaxID=28214 RepID=UPI001224462D|nr:molybdenum cofactor guanylyltransferase [Sphingomonas sp.]THD34595.1 MAG: molybdenum cofactor guanylyltransferase [Sphingomonas sp.]